MSTSASSPPTIGGTTQTYLWEWAGNKLSIIYETLGTGAPVLLLPAFSTVSTRTEMWRLAELLAPQFQVVAVDWPGFGQSSRPPLDYNSGLFQQFLAAFVKKVFATAPAVVAAGHATGYVMQLAQSAAWSQIVLVAPTWRGPLVAMTGKQQGWFGNVRQLVRSPILGQALYQLNTTPSFLRWMYQRHVYTDSAKLTPEFIQQKWQITQQPGARFAPVAFVTGALDPVQQQADFQKWFQSLSVPVLVVIGSNSPGKSLAEMEALAAIPGVQTQRLPGSLGLHEEYAEQLAEIVLSFLPAA